MRVRVKKACIILLIVLILFGTACGKEKTEPTVTLRADVTAEQMIGELAERYDLPESKRLENAADLAALLQIQEKHLISGCGRIAVSERDPSQLLLAQAEAGKTEKLAAALQNRLERIRQSLDGSLTTWAGQVITAGDYALLVIIAAEDAETVEQEIWEYFTTAQE